MKKIFLSFLAMSFLAVTVGVAKARAEETTGEKIEDKAGDVKTDTKKAGRKMKRKFRKATGTDSTMKDVKDRANDAGDDVSNAAKKAKNHVD